MSTYFYRAYGLGIQSDLMLPELIASEEAADVHLRLGSVDTLPAVPPPRKTSFPATAEEAYLFWNGVGKFHLREGREIVVDHVTGVDDCLLRSLILGPALGLVLYQRGLLVLHASAAAVNGNAIAFLGESGWGKSTLAATFYTRGHSIVSDDVTAIEVGANSSTVFPGFPQLKLWPDAVVSTGNDPEPLRKLHPLSEKRCLCVTRGFSQQPFPLKIVYVLTEGPSLEIEPLTPQETFAELIRHSYCVRKYHATAVSLHFLQCAKLANSVRICRLKRPRSLSCLPALAEFVEEDLARST